jgi:hypothetical protein
MKLLYLILAGVCLVVSISMNAEAKPFKTNSYTVNIPNGCETETEENRFSDDAFFKCKNMGNAEGNIAFEMAGSSYTGADAELPDQLMTVISDKWSDPHEVERGTDKYVVNNQTAPYVIATFKQEFTGLFGLPTKSENWVYMVVGIKTGDDMLYAQYKNSANKFDKQLPIFEKVLKSIKPVAKGEEESNSTKIGTETETQTDNPSTSRGNDFPKTRPLCDTVTAQSAKDLCETLLS